MSAPAYPRDFFISRAGPDAAWAEWIGWVLEEVGYSVHLQDWDFSPGKSFVRSMQEGASQCRRTIAVLSPDYFVSEYTTMEWEAALTRDPAGSERALVTVRVRPCEVPGLLGRYPYIDLVGQSEAGARSSLLRGVDPARRKPTNAPAFPGGASSHPSFPGDTPLRADGAPASGPLSGRRPPAGDAAVASSRAVAMRELPRPRHHGILTVALGVAPTGQVVRPAVLAGEDFPRRLTLAAMSTMPPILVAKDAARSVRDGVLSIEQRDASVHVASDGSMSVMMLGYDVPQQLGSSLLSGLIEEDVTDRLRLAVTFMDQWLSGLDGTGDLSTVAAAAGIYDAMALGWRTRGERDAQAGRGMTINPMKGTGEVALQAMHRTLLTSSIGDVAADLTALLRERLRP